MVIVSQNKERITEGMELYINAIIEEDEPIVYGIFVEKFKASFQLGHYKTKERAKEVLEEIITQYREENCEFENGMYHMQRIYRMPEDKED